MLQRQLAAPAREVSGSVRGDLFTLPSSLFAPDNSR